MTPPEAAAPPPPRGRPQWTGEAGSTRSAWLWCVAFAVLATLPWLPPPIGTPFHLELGAQVLTMAIFALSLQLLVGYTGLVSLGHAAFFGCAAYVVALLSPASEAGNGWALLAASVGGAALLALAIGLLVMRTRGIYFIMVTLAFAQLVYFVVHDTGGFGGSDGTYIYFRPEFRVGGVPLFDLQDPKHFYGFALALCAFTVAALALVLRSRLGHAFVGIRHNEQRMRAAGFATVAYKLASFVIGGGLAGLAGFLYAVRNGFVNPEILSWHQSGNALLMVILGGVGSLAGAVVGAASFVLLSEWFQSLTKHWQLLLGGFIILAVVLLPHGLVGGAVALRRRLRPASPEAAARPVPTEITP
jgi:branched-chain amino acid transport system permease protein